jgi:hypothetical protein
MENHEERVAFVVRFAGMDLDQLRAGDVLNLKEEMLSFLEWPPPRRRELTNETLKAVQAPIREELRKIATAVIETEIASSQSPEELLKHWKEQLRRLAEEGKGRGQAGFLWPDDSFHLPGTPASGLWKPAEVSLSTIAMHPQTAETGYGFPLALIKGEIVYDRKDGKTQLRARSRTFSDSFFHAFLVAFQRVDQHRIRPCPSCTRIFFSAHGNQEFCSLRCANRERTRRLREGKKEVAATPQRRKSLRGKEK